RSADAGLAPEAVHGQVVRDRHEPGGQSTAGGVEPRGLAPRGEEDVLGQLLRGLRAPEQPDTQRVDGSSEARVQRSHGVLVAGKEPFHQLLFLSREKRSIGPTVHTVSPFRVYGPVAGRSLPSPRSSIMPRDPRRRATAPPWVHPRPPSSGRTTGARRRRTVR